MMRKPCSDCPFVPARKFPLRPDRVREIEQALHQGGWFPCHKTTAAGSAPEGTPEAWCVGALAVMDREGWAGENQMVRICERTTGLPSPEDLADVDVFESFDKMREAMAALEEST